MPKPPVNRFRDPYESPDDVSHATMFFVVILLLVGVAGILYYGNSGLFASVNDATSVITQREFTPRPGNQTPPSAPLTNATRVPLATPTPLPITPSPAATGQPTPEPATTRATVASPPAASTPPPAATPPPAPSPTEVRALVIVANTNNDGVYVRRTPKLDDKLVAWKDGTVLQVLGERAQGDGVEWEKVRDPQGNVGWVPAQYLAPSR